MKHHNISIVNMFLFSKLFSLFHLKIFLNFLSPTGFEDRLSKKSLKIIILQVIFVFLFLPSTAIAAADSITISSRGGFSIQPHTNGNADFEGFKGGPFSPNSLEVIAICEDVPDPFTVEWTASNTQGWLQIIPRSRTYTCSNSGEVITIGSAELTNEANTLPPGFYTDTVTFNKIRDDGSSDVDQVIVTLLVKKPPIPPGTEIEKVKGEDVQIVAAGSDLELAVRVIDGGGQPLADVEVVWSLDEGAPAELDTEGPVITDLEGISENSVKIGRVAEPFMVKADVELQDGGILSEEFTFTPEPISSGTDPDTPEGAVGDAMDVFCPKLVSDSSQSGNPLTDRCDQLLTAPDASERSVALRAISPAQLSTQPRTGEQFARAQINNIGSRLAALRRGSIAALSVSGLTMNINGLQLSGKLMEELLLQKKGSAAGDEDRILPLSGWGFFINGAIGFGDRDATSQEDGFDFNTYGLTVGADYTFSEKLALGLALGYANADVDVDSNGGDMDADGFSITGYGNYNFTDNIFVEGLLSYGTTDYDLTRKIRYGLTSAAGNVSRVDAEAKGSTDSNPFSGMLGVGYDDLLLGSFQLDLTGRVRFLAADVEAYRERNAGAAGLNMEIGKQDVDSLVVNLGGTLSRPFDFQNLFGQAGIVTPQVFAEWEHEFEDDPVTITGQFALDPFNTEYQFDTDEFDSDYFRVGAGVSMWLMEGPQAYLIYDTLLGQDDYTEHRFNLGVRWDF